MCLCRRHRERRALRCRNGHLASRTCPASGKFCFPDRRAARQALRDAAAARRFAVEVLRDPDAGDRRQLRVYKCPDCHCWHLTSRTPW